MSLTKAVEAKRDELVQVARGWGENLSQRAFGERGPDLNVTLVDLEQFMRPLVQALASGFLGKSADEQIQRLAETLPCPTCGQECSREDGSRTLTGEEGPFTWSEPTCHCPQCDRSFFPSADGVED